jgi:hypothetical protein
MQKRWRAWQSNHILIHKYTHARMEFQTHVCMLTWCTHTREQYLFSPHAGKKKWLFAKQGHVQNRHKIYRAGEIRALSGTRERPEFITVQWQRLNGGRTDLRKPLCHVMYVCMYACRAVSYVYFCVSVYLCLSDCLSVCVKDRVFIQRRKQTDIDLEDRQTLHVLYLRTDRHRHWGQTDTTVLKDRQTWYLTNSHGGHISCRLLFRISLEDGFRRASSE